MTRTILIAALALSACTTTAPVTRAPDPHQFSASRTAPENALPGTCWDKRETPAVVETVVEDVLVQPAQISATGTVQSPPIYRSQTRPVIITDRKEDWFQILCPADLTPEFVSTVQRALALRNYHHGPVTGQIDTATQDAIRAFQTSEKIDTADPRKLTVLAAQRLGLWAVAPTDAS